MNFRYYMVFENEENLLPGAVSMKNKLNHKAMSVADFRTACHQFADHYIDVQREGFKRMGVVADWDVNPERNSSDVAVSFSFRCFFAVSFT